MEIMVFVGIFVVVIGVVLVLYWKYIVMGALALGCVAVMANHKSTVKDIVPLVNEKKEEVINQVKPQVEKPIDLSESKDVRKEFMDKCINMADYTRTQCEDIWDDRVKEERTLIEESPNIEDTKHKGKTNGNYRKV
jgi:long-subunit acyl-CoA synthetase (AMP-forming)